MGGTGSRWLLHSTLTVTYYYCYFSIPTYAFFVDTTKHSSPQIVEVPRLSVDEFRTYWQTLQEQQQPINQLRNKNDDHQMLTPIIITGALSSNHCEQMCSQFIETAQNDTTSVLVEIQRRRRLKQMQPQQQLQSKRRRPLKRQRERSNFLSTELLSYNVPLLQAIDTIMTQSNHNDAFWCFEEGLLERTGSCADSHTDTSAFQKIHDELQSMRQSLLQGGDMNHHNVDEYVEATKRTNWFDDFPKWAQSTDCVILSGVGSTSTLHRDPFEWTGTSVCLEGSKIWRFIEPKPDLDSIDTLVQSYRLPSVAWNDNTTISAGWQSDLSLYRNINNTNDSSNGIPRTAEELIPMKPITTNNETYDRLLHIAKSIEYLQPDEELQYLLNTTTIWTTVQQVGDFVIIPAQYWHQTYTFNEPTLTVSSQHCSDCDIYRVLNHITTITGITSIDIDNILRQCDRSPKERIQQFFHELEEKLV